MTRSTSTPIHTGEQIYLRQNFTELIEKQAVQRHRAGPVRHRRHRRTQVGGRVRRPARHPDGAPRHRRRPASAWPRWSRSAATLPQNYIAFEYPVGNPDWWYDIVDGLPDPIVKDSFIDVWDRPGMGVELNIEAAREHLAEEDADFFD